MVKRYFDTISKENKLTRYKMINKWLEYYYESGSTKYHLSSKWFQVFKSYRDRHDLVNQFVSLLVGVAATFRAPVSGVLFALEEVTSW
ncbi:hypothetical protein Fmac_015624 [Flemingia macrophylla]|uniref:Uncharacterized protein n=1 Tax=Flemingia macrophylla TaxID=520843 RepID=A0ABD1MF80_9FABA